MNLKFLKVPVETDQMKMSTPNIKSFSNSSIASILTVQHAGVLPDPPGQREFPQPALAQGGRAQLQLILWCRLHDQLRVFVLHNDRQTLENVL